MYAHEQECADEAEATRLAHEGAVVAKDAEYLSRHYTPPDPAFNMHMKTDPDKGTVLEGGRGVTQTSIRLHWSPPVMQGGLRVEDYEISYRTSWCTMRGKTVQRQWSDFVTVQTSWWAQRRTPVR